jgi:hypothetical protein
MLITPSQCRAARAFLGLESQKLSDACQQHHPKGTPLARAVISKFENSPDDDPAGSASSVAILTHTLEALGVRFVRDGVFLESDQAQRSVKP